MYVYYIIKHGIFNLGNMMYCSGTLHEKSIGHKTDADDTDRGRT